MLTLVCLGPKLDFVETPPISRVEEKSEAWNIWKWTGCQICCQSPPLLSRPSRIGAVSFSGHYLYPVFGFIIYDRNAEARIFVTTIFNTALSNNG
jgi:hypothetical protein